MNQKMIDELLEKAQIIAKHGDLSRLCVLVYNEFGNFAKIILLHFLKLQVILNKMVCHTTGYDSYTVF